MTNTPLDIVERLRVAFDEAPPDARRLRTLAAAYKYDERAEQLLQLRQAEPAVFAQFVTPTIRMSLGSYEQSKAAAEQLQKEKTS